MKKYVRASTVAAMLAVSPVAANAIPVEFNLSMNPGQSTNYNNLSNSFSLTVDGLTATFTAGAFTNPGSLDNTGQDRNITNTAGGYTVGGPNNTLNPATDVRIGRYNGGAGVVTRPGDDHQVDGNGWDNFITASFSFNGQAVDVAASEVDFGLFGGNDNFRWGYDLSGDGTYGTGDFLSFNQNSNPFSNFGGVESGLFLFGAFDTNDEWKLNSFTVDYTPSAVPLPAALPLMGAGFAALGFVGWRRKRKAA